MFCSAETCSLGNKMNTAPMGVANHELQKAIKPTWPFPRKEGSACVLKEQKFELSEMCVLKKSYLTDRISERGMSPLTHTHILTWPYTWHWGWSFIISKVFSIYFCMQNETCSSLQHRPECWMCSYRSEGDINTRLRWKTETLVQQLLRNIIAWDGLLLLLLLLLPLLFLLLFYFDYIG